MAYSEKLADRVRIALEDVPKVEEKKMFRGLTFMVDDKMCVCIGEDRLMCRIDPALHDDLLDQQPCRSMVMKGKEYKGFILVNEDDVASNRDLNFWVKLCLDFNPYAKASKKKKKATAAAKKKKAGPAKKALTVKKNPAPAKKATTTAPEKKKKAPAKKKVIANAKKKKAPAKKKKK
jgi:TfoX/Sxy family transcriptional regulator of competence genes